MVARRVVITGGATGIGRAIAHGFASLGDKVCICDKSSKFFESLKQEIPSSFVVEADISNETQVTKFFSQVCNRFGGIDILISNAGTSGPAGKFEDLELSDWQECLSVNLNGAFLSGRFAAKLMRNQGSGLIIFISSTSGLFGVPYRSPYVVAKWGLIGLTKTLAMELGPVGVRVNAICPGSVNGERMEQVLKMESASSGRSPEAIAREYRKSVSLKKFVSAEDVANMALFLASDSANKITGQALAVDGHTERMA